MSRGSELSIEPRRAGGRSRERLFAHDESGHRSAVEARVSRIVRRIEEHPDAALRLKMPRGATRGLSPYHFLRTFEQVTGATPHQIVRRTRLRQAASRLLAEPGQVLEIALECGFGDVSNFNHAFRAEFGVSPRQFRQASVPCEACVCFPVSVASTRVPVSA